MRCGVACLRARGGSNWQPVEKAFNGPAYAIAAAVGAAIMAALSVLIRRRRREKISGEGHAAHRAPSRNRV